MGPQSARPPDWPPPPPPSGDGASRDLSTEVVLAPTGAARHGGPVRASQIAAPTPLPGERLHVACPSPPGI
eukprot:9192895-Pyramimonas_sp.AAC.1